MNPTFITISVDTHAEITLLAKLMKKSFSEAFKVCVFAGLRANVAPTQLDREQVHVSVRLTPEIKADILKLKPSGRAFVSFTRDLLEASLREPTEQVELPAALTTQSA